MLRGLFSRLFGSRGGATSRLNPERYAAAKKEAASRDVATRRRLAGRPDTQEEILYYLAGDPDAGVRRAIAENRATPRHADLLLARDGDGAVRSTLAEKIAQLAPGLNADEQDRVRAMTYEVLEILAHDHMVRVREILSQTLKDIADAPPALIRRLAWDAELVVSGPVLEHSPVLSDADLIEIIRSGPLSGALQAISRRTPVSEPVSDAIVAVDDVDAVTQLLGNKSAQIREKTLDHLIDRAQMVRAWHAPLVRRPSLSPAAATRLAEFVADNLLETLSKRRDLPAGVLAEVKAEVHRRLKDADPVETSDPAPSGNMDEAIKRAEILYRKSELYLHAITDAVQRDDRLFVLAAIAVRADLPVAVIEKAIETESIKGIVAIAWKAGLPAKIGTQLQRYLLHVPPGEVLGAEGSGYSLGDDEMNWQIEFLKGLL